MQLRAPTIHVENNVLTVSLRKICWLTSDHYSIKDELIILPQKGWINYGQFPWLAFNKMGSGLVLCNCGLQFGPWIGGLLFGSTGEMWNWVQRVPRFHILFSRDQIIGEIFFCVILIGLSN